MRQHSEMERSAVRARPTQWGVVTSKARKLCRLCRPQRHNKCEAFLGRLRHNPLCSFYLEQINVTTYRHQERKVVPHKGLVESIWFQFWFQKWMDRVLLTPSDVQLRLKNQQSDGTLKLGRNASGYLGVIFKNCLQFLYQTRL